MSPDPAARALLFEEHSSVLPHWWGEPVRARTLVYLDAHLDLQWVNPERIARLRQCATVAQVAALEKPHDLWPDGEFGYSIENFLYPASRLGLIGRLIWVAPPHVAAGYAERALGQLRQMDGLRPEELASFRRLDGRIEGRLLGLELTLCDFRQLERLALPADCALDIDVDYFVKLPGDEPWIDPREVLEALRRLPRAGPLTISRSVGSGFTPLRYRFLGDYLAALWERRDDAAGHYARLFELDRRLRAGEREAAAAALAAEAARRPECAATWYLLGLAQADPAEAERFHARAAQASAAYAPNALRDACAIRNRRLATDRAEVMRLGRELKSLAPAEQGLAWVALGLLCCAFGDLQGGLACHRNASATLGAQGPLALELGRLLMQAGRAEEAAGFLRLAASDDRERSAALASLAFVSRRCGDLARARSELEQAHRAAPCWDEALQALAGVYRELGEQALAQACAERLAALRAEQDALRRRLAAR